MTHALLAALLLAPTLAHAAPPPVGSDDWNVMAPYAEWIQKQYLPDGRWCCSIADGRPVDAEIRQDSTGSHWWAHVTPQHFPGEEDHWVKVPDDKVHTGANPTGFPILWYNTVAKQPYCFAPNGGV